MKTRRNSLVRRTALALAAAVATLALGAGSAAAFEPLGTQYGVGFPGGDGPGIVETPTGVAIGADGSVIVADAFRNRVLVFDQSGRFRLGFGKDVSQSNPGSGPEVCRSDCQAGQTGISAGELDEIWGVAADANSIYVAERGNSRVSVFDYGGNFQRAFGKEVGGPGVDVCTTVCQEGSPGTVGGSIADPYGIALASGRLYVSNSSISRVEVFDAASGAFQFAFGKGVGGAGVNTCTASCQPGTADLSPGSVTAAFALAVGPGGDVYTAGPADGKISVFDANGIFLRQIGAGLGNGAGQLNAPFGIAVDGAGTIYVGDVALNRLSVFGPGGEFRAAYGRNVVPGAPGGAEVCTVVCGPGESGSGSGELTTNLTVTTDCRGSVYVGMLGRVDKWGELGVAPPPCPPPPAGDAPATAPLAKPSNVIKLGKLKLNRKKGTATLVVKVPGPGTLKLAAGKKVKATAPRPKRAGKIKVTIKAKGKGVKALNRSGKLKGTLRLTFRPAGGDARTVPRKFTLIKTGYPRR